MTHYTTPQPDSPSPNTYPAPLPKDAFPSEQDLGRLLHTWLDGSQGTNRNRTPGVARQIEADTDIEAIAAWLKAKSRKSFHTQRSYQREAYRLVAWAVSFKEKPVSSLLVDDISDFHNWLATPVNHPAWEERGWELFKGPLSENSQLQSLRILQGMFRWLCEAGYLSGNPFKIYDAGTIAKKSRAIAKTKQRRYLPHALWVWLQERLDELKPPNNKGGAFLSYERKRFILNFLYWSGLRRFELATAMMSQIRADEDQWVLDVVGKGRDASTADEVLLPPPAMDALQRYRCARGLPPYPTPHETEIPLVAASDGSPISDNYLNRILKDFLARIAPLAAAENPTWSSYLNQATAHWMRHTLATHSAEAGVPIQTTADQLRHASIETTRRIYTHADVKKRRNDLGKLVRYNQD